MDLRQYFESAKGLGVLATADAAGHVDVAVYARPHVMDEATVAWIMSDRLSHRNLQSNPCAVYLFVEDGPGYKGKRLYLTKVREEADPKLIESLRRTGRPRGEDDVPRFVVTFHIDQVRPAVGQ